MGILGDFWPDREKQEYVDTCLSPGRVLRLSCEFTSPPKEKLLVLVCLHSKPRPLLFFINSHIHPYIRKRRWLRDCQVLLRASDYSCLNRDSFVNCSEVVNGFELPTIKGQLLDDMGRIEDELRVDVRREIVRVVRAATTISCQHKRLIVQALS